MFSTRRIGRTLARLVLLLAAAATAAPRASLAQEARQQSTGSPTVTGIAAQLGVTVRAPDYDDLGLGASFTGTLKDPAKLAAFGIKGMHAGARVSVTRISPDKVQVEADELEPVPTRASVKLRLEGGTLVAGEKKG